MSQPSLSYLSTESRGVSPVGLRGSPFGHSARDSSLHRAVSLSRPQSSSSTRPQSVASNTTTYNSVYWRNGRRYDTQRVCTASPLARGYESRSASRHPPRACDTLSLPVPLAALHGGCSTRSRPSSASASHRAQWHQTWWGSGGVSSCEKSRTSPRSSPRRVARACASADADASLSVLEYSPRGICLGEDGLTFVPREEAHARAVLTALAPPPVAPSLSTSRRVRIF